MTRKELIVLEEKGEHVFHGSGVRVEELEPRGAHAVRDETQIPGGRPVIFASLYVEYAIFMALVNKVNCPKGSRSGVSFYEDGSLAFEATRATLEQLCDASKGYVYVFQKSDFEEQNSHELVRHENIKPLEVIEISRKDFELEIKIIENDGI